MMPSEASDLFRVTATSFGNNWPSIAGISDVSDPCAEQVSESRLFVFDKAVSASFVPEEIQVRDGILLRPDSCTLCQVAIDFLKVRNGKQDELR